MTILKYYMFVRDRVYADIAKVVIGGLEAENCRHFFLEKWWIKLSDINTSLSYLLIYSHNI